MKILGAVLGDTQFQQSPECKLVYKFMFLIAISGLVSLRETAFCTQNQTEVQ